MIACIQNVFYASWHDNLAEIRFSVVVVVVACNCIKNQSFHVSKFKLVDHKKSQSSNRRNRSPIAIF